VGAAERIEALGPKTADEILDKAPPYTTFKHATLAENDRAFRRRADDRSLIG
jgi:hypothetical protein